MVIVPGNSDTVIVACGGMYSAGNGIYRTTNGGLYGNWTETNDPSQFNNNPVLTMDISSTSTDVVYAATMPWNNRSQIFRTFNGGATWVDITQGLPDRVITDIHVDKNNHEIVYITFGGFGTSHLYMTHNAGDTWHDIGEELPDIPAWSVTNDPMYPEIIYFGNEFGVYISYDEGNIWQEYMDGFGDGVFAMDLKISMSNRKIRVASHGNGSFERPLEVSSDIADNNILQNNKIELNIF